MDSSESRAFKSAMFGGFDKNDVNTYIENMANLHSERVAKLRGELKDVSDEKTKLAEQLRESEEKIENLTAENQMLSNDIAELKSVSERLGETETEKEDTETKLSEKESEISELREKLRALEERVDKLSQVESEYTLRKSGLAEIEIAAHARATEIRQKAEAEADERIRAIDVEIAEKLKAFEARKQAAVSETNEVYDKLRSAYNGLKSEVDGFDVRIMRLVESVRTNVTTLSLACDSAGDKLVGIQTLLSDSDDAIEE